MTGLLRTAVKVAVGVAVAAAVLTAMAHAQGVPDAQALVVSQPAPVQDRFTGSPADLTWPVAAYLTITRFLTVLERMVTDTRGWADRWLDKTAGKIRIDYKKTIVSTWAEDDQDRTGPIRMNRRRDDPGRNGASDQ